MGLGVKPQLLHKLPRNATCVAVLCGEFEGSEQALLQIGNAAFDKMGKGTIIGLHAPQAVADIGKRGKHSQYQKCEQQHVAAAAGIPPGFNTTEGEGKKNEGGQRQTGVLKDEQPVPATADGLEGLAQIFERLRSHKESSLLSANRVDDASPYAPSMPVMLRPETGV